MAAGAVASSFDPFHEPKMGAFFAVNSSSVRIPWSRNAASRVSCDVISLTPDAGAGA